jgi:hypothetical protein
MKVSQKFWYCLQAKITMLVAAHAGVMCGADLGKITYVPLWVLEQPTGGYVGLVKEEYPLARAQAEPPYGFCPAY